MSSSFFEEGEDYTFLENITCIVNDETISMYDFLHGYCDVFAHMLSKEYPEYIPMGVYEYGKLVHAYCETDTGYMDIRGETDSFDDLMQTFYDDGLFENMDETVIKPLKINEKRLYPNAKEASLYFITEYRKYYDNSPSIEIDI